MNMLSLGKGIEIALSKLGEYKIYGSEAVSKCPFCNSDKHKFYLNNNTGLYSCKRASCGAHGNINQLLEHFGIEDRVKYSDEILHDKKETKKINVDINKFIELKDNDDIVEYMASRGITIDTLNSVNAKRYGNALVLPTTKDGRIVNIAYRTPDKRIWQESGSMNYLFGRENLDFNNKRIYISEGRVDMLTLVEMGYENCVSMPMGAGNHEWINLEWDLLKKFEEIVLLYDNDTPGKQGLETAKSRLDFARIFTINFDKYKDINEAYMKDSSFLYQSIENAKELQLDGFISLNAVSTADGVNDELHSCGISQFDTIFGGIRMGESSLVVSSSGAGKALRMDAKLYSEDGIILMKDIKVGDKIFGDDGQLHKVTGVFPQGKKRVVRVSFSDCTYVDCCDEHLWNVITESGEIYTKSVKEILNDGVLIESLDKKYNKPMFSSIYRIPLTKPIQFKEKEHYIKPYLLGALIGDGGLTDSIMTFSTNEEYMVEKVKSLLSDGYMLRKNGDNNYSLIIKSDCGSTGRNDVVREIKRLGLNVISNYKFIPKEYLFDSVENRMGLLRGLFDTSGHIKESRATIQTVSKQLKDDIVWLCRSLGMIVTVGEDSRDKYSHDDKCYVLYIRFDVDNKPFTSPKHMERYCEPIIKKEPRKYIKSIEYLDEEVEMQCISVDNPSKLYITDDFIVTHNTTVLCNMVKGILSQDEKCGVYSGELMNASLKAWIYSTIGGNKAVDLKPHPFRKGEFLTSINKDAEIEIDKKIKGRLWVYDGSKNNAYIMLKNFSALNKRFGVKYFFIDNLSILDMSVKGMGMYEAEDHFAKELAEFCRTHRCHVFLFAHPTKQNLNSDPEFIDRSGRIKPIQRYDQYSVRGSATLVNLSHNIMFLMRAKEWEKQYFIQSMRDKFEKGGMVEKFNLDVLPKLKEEFSLFAYLVKNRGFGKTYEDALFGYDSNTRRIYGIMTKEEDLSREVEVEEIQDDFRDEGGYEISYEDV